MRVGRAACSAFRKPPTLSAKGVMALQGQRGDRLARSAIGRAGWRVMTRPTGFPCLSSRNLREQISGTQQHGCLLAGWVPDKREALSGMTNSPHFRISGAAGGNAPLRSHLQIIRRSATAPAALSVPSGAGNTGYPDGVRQSGCLC